ncbi:MAG: hypothetical protein ACP5P2_01215 [Candidatus Micrarchaeia archaeon]|jgi:hypothetical protein
MASILGYFLIALGVVLLLLTFLMGYGLYESLSTQSYVQSGQPSPSNVTGAISSLTSNLSLTARETGFIFLEIIVLFLFANIGYKLSYLGIKLVKGEDEDKKK